MNLIDDIKTESLYTSDSHRRDAIGHSLNVEDVSDDEFIIIQDNEIIEDESDIPYNRELSKTDNRINRSRNLSWEDMLELEDV